MFQFKFPMTRLFYCIHNIFSYKYFTQLKSFGKIMKRKRKRKTKTYCGNVPDAHEYDHKDLFVSLRNVYCLFPVKLINSILLLSLNSMIHNFKKIALIIVVSKQLVVWLCCWRQHQDTDNFCFKIIAKGKSGSGLTMDKTTLHISEGENFYLYLRFKQFQIGNLWDPNYGILACIVIKKSHCWNPLNLRSFWGSVGVTSMVSKQSPTASKRMRKRGYSIDLLPL